MTQSPYGPYDPPQYEEPPVPVFDGSPEKSMDMGTSTTSERIKAEQGDNKTEEKDKDKGNFVDNLKNKALDFATDLNPTIKAAKDAANVVDIMAQNEAGVSKENRASQEAEAAVVLGGIDFALDAVGKIPGAESIDDAWDEKTKFQTPLARDVRDIASIVVPSLILGPVAGSASKGLAAKAGISNAFAKGAIGLTGRVGTEMAIVGISDYTERDEGLATALDGLLDKMGNPLGMDIPEAAKIMDGDSQQKRRTVLQLEAAGAEIIADAVGYLLNKPVKGLLKIAGKGLDWFKPKSDSATEFINFVKQENPDIETIEVVQQYRAIAEQASDPKVAKKYNDFADKLLKQLDETGISEVTTDPAES